ncbi:hypothetical protein J8J40_26555, partial [Mycobacterium tuberculosis]|nr:hypothetical protein [Mycobacterium tuberculosis]
LIGVFVTLYALGWYTPAFRIFYDYLPGVPLYRRPADATFMIGFALAVLGGYSVHAYVSGETGRASSLARFLQIVALLALFVALPYAFARHADR